MQRRTVLACGGALLTTTVAGCSSDGNGTDSAGDSSGGDSTDDDDSDLAETDEASTVDSADVTSAFDPAVTALRHPEPQGVSTDDESASGNRHEFSITVENTGMAGDIKMVLVLLEDQETSIWSPMADEAGSYQRFFSDGERRTESFTTEWDSQYKAFGFRLIPAEAEVDIRNEGERGEAEVRLLQQGGLGDGVVLESKTVDIPAETTKTVGFSVDASFTFEQNIDDIQLGAEVYPA